MMHDNAAHDAGDQSGHQGSAEAKAIPRQSGMATKKTTTPPMRSRPTDWNGRVCESDMGILWKSYAMEPLAFGDDRRFHAEES